jgi:hypothetical protein
MRWIVMSCALALTTGCARTDVGCAVFPPIWMGSGETADWLLENDEQMLRAVVSHNEKHKVICK